MPTALDTQALKSQVLDLTYDVGRFIWQEGQNFDPQNIEYKGLNDLVSYVDKEAEKKLVTGLKKILPQAGIIGEEGTGNEKDPHLNWVIDPVDGTTNFLHGLPIFSTSIGLVENNEPIVGVVNDIGNQALYHAVPGGGAYKNEAPIRVSPAQKVEESLLATGFPYFDFRKMQNYLDIVEEFMRGSHGLRRMGSAALDLVYVAEGIFEGFFEYNLKPWDVAGGALIVREAGGRVSDFQDSDKGEDFIFGKEILAAGPTHAEILGVIRKYW